MSTVRLPQQANAQEGFEGFMASFGARVQDSPYQKEVLHLSNIVMSIRKADIRILCKARKFISWPNNGNTF